MLRAQDDRTTDRRVDCPCAPASVQMGSVSDKPSSSQNLGPGRQCRQVAGVAAWPRALELDEGPPTGRSPRAQHPQVRASSAARSAGGGSARAPWPPDGDATATRRRRGVFRRRGPRGDPEADGAKLDEQYGPTSGLPEILAEGEPLPPTCSGGARPRAGRSRWPMAARPLRLNRKSLRRTSTIRGATGNRGGNLGYLSEESRARLRCPMSDAKRHA